MDSLVRAALARQEAGFKGIMPREELNLGLRDGWLFKRIEFYGYPPPGYEWDPALVRAIQNTFPEFQPFWVNYIFLSPVEEGQANREYVKFGRHGYGRYIKDPHSEVIPMPVKMPSRRAGFGFRMRPVTKIEDVMRGVEDPRAKDLPGAYMKFDWWLLGFLKENWKEWSVAELRAANSEAEDSFYEESRQRQSEQHQSTADFTKYAQKKLAQVSDIEAKEYFLHGSAKAEPVAQIQVPSLAGLAGESTSSQENS